MFKDTALVRMSINLLKEKHDWTYEETLDKFYTSKVCEGLSNRETGIFTFAPKDIVTLFDEAALV